MRRRMGFQLWDLEKLGASLEGYKYKVLATNSRKVPSLLTFVAGQGAELEPL